MTQPGEISTAKPADAIPAKAEGVNVDAAIKAFREERSKDKAAEAAEDKPAKPEGDADPAKAASGASDEQSSDVRESFESDAQTSVEVPEKDALKVKLRSKVAARQRDIEAKEQRLAQREAELRARDEALEAQNRAIAEERQRFEGLRGKASTDPRAVLKELGINLPDVVNAELAEMSPEARSKQMGKMLENLPKLIEEKAAELVQKHLTEREEAQKKQYTEAQKQQAIAASEKAFIDRAKDAEKYPHLAKVATQDDRFAVHTAYYIQSVFQKEHGRLPTDKELDLNVNKYLGERIYGEEPSTKPASPSVKKTSPRAAAKEVAEKPIAEMTAEERMAAAEREFRRIRAADRETE